MTFVFEEQEVAESRLVLRALKSRHVEVLRVVIEALLEARSDDLRQGAVADDGDLRIAASGVENEHLFLTVHCVYRASGADSRQRQHHRQELSNVSTVEQRRRHARQDRRPRSLRKRSRVANWQK